MLFMVFKREQMALPAHGHIIEEPRGRLLRRRNKTGLGEKKTVLGKKDEATARKIREERAGQRETKYVWKVFNHMSPIHN